MHLVLRFNLGVSIQNKLPEDKVPPGAIDPFERWQVGSYSMAT